MHITSELRKYLEAVHEANERIVAKKRRELDPNLHEDDLPWLVRENEQMRLQIVGHTYIPSKEFPEKPEEMLSEDEANALIGQLVILSAEWHTWHDVIDAAENMNKAIEKVLG